MSKAWARRAISLPDPAEPDDQQRLAHQLVEDKARLTRSPLLAWLGPEEMSQAPGEREQ
jgi:hypothetical protein